MSKYLIFRTDRIGDYIFSRILTESIKKKDPKNTIDFVCSSYNSKYVKNFSDIKKIYILDKYDLNLMIKNIFEINSVNYDYLIILDGKRRSVFFSILLKAKKKFAILKDFRPYLILKIFFDNYFINSESQSQYNNFSSVINYLDMKVPNKVDYYNGYIIKKTQFNQLPLNFTLLHLDEKWFEGHYYNDFKYMNLDVKNFRLLINSIYKKFKKSIVITGGNIDIKQFNLIKDKFFTKINKDTYSSNLFSHKLLFIDNTDFRDLEYIVNKCTEVFCCEGAISHVSNAFQKKTFALINNFNTAKFWTSHMSNLKLLQRDNITKICKQITLN